MNAKEPNPARDLSTFAARQEFVRGLLVKSLDPLDQSHPKTWPRRAYLALTGLLYLEMLHNPESAENLASLGKILSEAKRAHSRKTVAANKSASSRRALPHESSELTDEQLARTIRDLYGLDFPPPAFSHNPEPVADLDSVPTLAPAAPQDSAQQGPQVLATSEAAQPRSVRAGTTTPMALRTSPVWPKPGSTPQKGPRRTPFRSDDRLQQRNRQVRMPRLSSNAHRAWQPPARSAIRGPPRGMRIGIRAPSSNSPP